MYEESKCVIRFSSLEGSISLRLWRPASGKGAELGNTLLLNTTNVPLELPLSVTYFLSSLKEKPEMTTWKEQTMQNLPLFAYVTGKVLDDPFDIPN